MRDSDVDEDLAQFELEQLGEVRVPPLAFSSLLELLRDAFNRAMAVPLEERRRDMFEQHIYCLLHPDAADESTEAWARMGAHAGAMRGWVSFDQTRHPPKGAPSPYHATLHASSWTLACQLIWQFKAELVIDGEGQR